MVSYAFVKDIQRKTWRAEELALLRGQAIGDSHCDAILKEALLDRDYDRRGLGARVAEVRRQGDWLLTSFPDREVTGNVLVRSEFLIMRHVGGGTLPLRNTERYCQATVDRILAAAPAAIMYRCCDYDAEDFSFFDEQDAGVRGYASCRGLQRLLAQPDLLALDLAVVDRLLDTGLPVRLLMPFVQFPSQMRECRDVVERRYAGRARRPDQLGMMLEVPANLYQLREFAMADFFVYGPSDLLKFLFGGIDRNEPAYARVEPRALLEPVRHSLDALESLGGKEVFFAKSLIDLATELDLTRFARTRIRSLYMPSQLASLAADDRTRESHGMHRSAYA
jgi:hypothetical protein